MDRGVGQVFQHSLRQGEGLARLMIELAVFEEVGTLVAEAMSGFLTVVGGADDERSLGTKSEIDRCCGGSTETTSRLFQILLTVR